MSELAARAAAVSRQMLRVGYRKHLSSARASALVYGPEIIELMVRADYAEGDRLLEYLTEAREMTTNILRDINAAIQIEVEALPSKVGAA